MMFRFNKRGDFPVPIHWLIIFVVILIVIVIMAFSAFQKSGGLLGGLFSAIRGGGG